MQTLDLSGFYGSPTLYRNPLTRLGYTEGVQYFAENAGGGAYWFLDLIMFEYRKILKREGFLSIVLTVENNQATIDASDGNGVYFKKRHIEYTDCPSGEYRFYFVGDDTPILMLTSEY
jgi:hypothetical protein